jgi:acetyl/propionyl-CoA carboxylase alpha subunit
VLADEVFRSGAAATNFLDVRRERLTFGEPAAAEIDAVLAAVWLATRETGADALWADSRGWRLGSPPRSAWAFAEHSVVVEMAAADRYIVRGTGPDYRLRLIARGAQSLDVEVDDEMQRLRIVELQQELHLFRAGRHSVLRLNRTEDALQGSSAVEQGSLLTPLPGTIVATHVTPGQQVARGAPLVTVEAMKMEHTLTAPYDGIVTRVAFGVTERVAAGAILVELAPLGSEPF